MHMRGCAWTVLAAAACLVGGVAPAAAEVGRLAAPIEVDESQYGCGPMRRPGTTYYVSVHGSDQADGLSWKTARRTVINGMRRLQAGDTLLISDGEYRVNSLSFRQKGEPGRPVRLMAAPRCRVILNCAIPVGPFRKAAGKLFTCEAPLKMLLHPDVWVRDSLVKLQPAGSPARVEALPGTYHHAPKDQKLFVHFPDGRDGAGRFVEARKSHRGISPADYTLVKGIWFKHGWEGLLVRRSTHVTVEDCAFYANVYHGLCLRLGANRCLIKGNYGCRNPMRGSILMHGSSHHNLLTGNRGDRSVPTVRTRGSHFFYAMNNYGGADGPGNRLINNILNDQLSFRWKPPVRGMVFQGNVAIGQVYSQKAAWKDRKPSDRMVIRNNVILGRMAWHGGLGPGGGNGDWLDPDKAFVNNFHAAGDPKAVVAARFADPDWLDFRLQSDSPLLGKGAGGHDRGAFPAPQGRVLYVGPRGDDARTGTSERLAFQSLRKAAGSLRVGDTLYIMHGAYPEPLVIESSGARESPIRVRAYHKARFALPGIVVRGSHVTLEGLHVADAPGDGVHVSGADVALRHGLIHGCSGAGLRAQRATGLSLHHATFAGNRVGVSLEHGSTRATVRNCVVARNREAPMRLDDSSREGYKGYSSLYAGPGVDADRVAAEVDSITAPPRFVDAAHGDYRLAWDSPARYLGEFARAAGSEDAVARPARISAVRVCEPQPDSAVVLWQTPGFDTGGEARYRRKGAPRWTAVGDPTQGSDHAAGLVGLRPGTTYEVQIVATHRRGPGATSAVTRFTTPTAAREPLRFHVSPQGNDAADGRSAQSAWRTIRHACRQVAPGDTVLVAPGVYREQISPCRSGTKTRRITFRKIGDGDAVLDAMGVLAAPVLMTSKHHVTIDGFSLDIGESGWLSSPSLIVLTGCRDVEILNCRRVALGKASSVSAGVIARGCHNLRIEGNVIWGARYHLRLFDCRNALVRNNTLVGKSVVTVQLGDVGLPSGGARFVNNLLYETRSFRNAFVWVYGKSLLHSDHNLFYTSDRRLGLAHDPSVGQSAADLAAWRTWRGHDRHSLEADPLFVDVDKRDFRLKPGSPAIGAGLDGADIGALGVAR